MWELIVVDNGSTDGTRPWLESFGRRLTGAGIGFKLILNAGNIGCSTARNQGLAAASGAHVMFMDNDVAVRSRGWLMRLGARLSERPDVGMVGPKLVYPFDPHAIQFAGGAVSPSGRVQFMGRGEARMDPRFNVAREVNCFISACLMAKRSVLTEAGGFDEAFNPVEYEDIDLCYRIRSGGHKILYEPGVEMYHFESVTTAGTPGLPNTYLIIKHGLLFKERWRHMFEHENGPTDAETRWRAIETRPLNAVDDLPLAD